jgi:hypothetical protein
MIGTIQETTSWSYSSSRMPDDLWQMIRALVFQIDNYTCRWCGATGVELHCDHIVPLSKGGTNSPYNLHTLCRRCNIAKGSNEPVFVVKAPMWRLWQRLIEAQPELLAVYQTARMLRDDRTEKWFCANWHFYTYGGLKERLSSLVGSSHQYDFLLGRREA